jgi:hypothetical protein
VVSQHTATDKLSEMIEGGPLNREIALDEFKQQVVDLVWMKEVKQSR